MKFTDGFWQLRPGVEALYGAEAYDVERHAERLVVTAPTKVIASRGDTLNRPALTVTLHSPLDGVIGVRIEHHSGGAETRSFDLPGAGPDGGTVSLDADAGTLDAGSLRARIWRGAPWNLEFFDAAGRRLTGSGHKAQAYLRLAADAQVDGGPVGNARAGSPGPRAATYVHEQLDLGVGELVYGLGERFGPLVKNGQTVEVWNADGGTSSEQAYKNVPFYLTNRGYGVLVDHPGHVSFEVGSEAVERVQFSVAGEALQYYVIAGDTPADVLERYTRLTGRAPMVPAWSYGLWLSTSFTTSYDESTVIGFIDAMAERRIPLSVFHFDCFWMREFNWSDFEWDTRVFPDPEGMLARLHDKDLHVCVWINPYIAQRSPLFDEARRLGHLVRRPDGSVWQWDLWQAGMAIVDFTSPAATSWYQDKLRGLLDSGVDAFKTDFGERIPVDVVYADGSDPERMHNLYTQLYNRAVFDVLQERHGEGQAVVFARSATVGGQSLPVHWGGDSTSSFASMAETLRGGLSLALSGFAYWSHDIGGFEGTPDADVFKRWVAFGMLSSHSRLHGSDSYRVPWAFDDEAVDVTRRFVELKARLMPMLWAASRAATERGIPIIRPMALAYPDDPAAAYLDRQYLLGPDLLVAPVFDASGEVDVYLPAGGWTSLLDGTRAVGPGWRRERHAADSLPLYVRDGAVLPLGGRTDRPDYDYLEGLELRVHPTPDDGSGEVTVHTTDGRAGVFRATWTASRVVVESDIADGWSASLPGGAPSAGQGGRVELER